MASLAHVTDGGMEPCHSVVTGSRAPATSAATVAHLIRNIEQLKNKDKLISQLEKDLGHTWAAAHLAALEQRGVVTGRPPPSPPPPAPGALPAGSMEPTVSWTPPPALQHGAVEVERSAGDEGFAFGKSDSPNKLKDCKERNKLLADKCRVFLQKNKELTAQNRAYKDSNVDILKEQKHMHELLEHSKLQILQLSRQISELKAERSSLVQQSDSVQQLHKEMAEDKKTIGALKQACSEKDRRIELIQHRKKRRRIMQSAEKNAGPGLRETFYGYDEDNRSVDSERSQGSSVSRSTRSLSDDDLWDDVMSREETERGHQRLMMEQLQLQKSHALLQSQMGHSLDPQREARRQAQMQHDLFQSQCRVEHLEKLINEIGEGEVMSLLKEREGLVAEGRALAEKLHQLEELNKGLEKELATAQEREEDLEFRLLEYEHREEEETSPCGSVKEGTVSLTPLEVTSPAPLDPSTLPLPEDDEEDEPHHVQQQQLGLSPCPEGTSHGQHHSLDQEPKDLSTMEQLYKEINTLLKGRGREGEAVLKKLDRIREEEKKSSGLAHELQLKVISLQKERDHLQDELSHRGGASTGGAAAAASRERQENLELKGEVKRLVTACSELCEERSQLHEEVDDWKTQYEFLKQQLDLLTHQPRSGKQKKHFGSTKSTDPGSSEDSSPPSLKAAGGKPAPDRKSKSRGGDDLTPKSKKRKGDRDSAAQSSKMLRSFKSFGDIKSADDEHSGEMRASKSIESISTRSVSPEESRMTLMQTVYRLESELRQVQSRNAALEEQLKQAVLEKSTEAEVDQQMLLDKLHAMDSELCLLRQENVALGQQLRQRVEEFHDSQGQLQPKLEELEDFCEDLQERLHGAELSERQHKEKLRLLEASIEEAEMSEMAAREESERLVAREEATKNQLKELQRTVCELKDIILDKDIVEQALRDKVDFLQKAEAASVKRIEELEAIEQELREQLQEASSGTPGQREHNKIQELQHQITFLETDNRALSARAAELEENEETLRENWRRVADEDFNRTQCLEEKVKLLQSMNRDLKTKLSDAQEYYVINTVPSGNTSLAAELAGSQSSLRSVKGSNSDLTEDHEVDPEEMKRIKEEDKALKDKVRKLERKLSDVSELKNSKIEQLQERLGGLAENEIKLSETISEMEMTERELKAKLALYESSEVTVEKMLKYQSTIEELRTSQESLLDQLESKENQEMTLQEKMQEMERTLRGKIVTLEVEMKNLKQKEIKAASRIRELEKQEKDLTEKVAQQAEKENGLYITINSLKEDLKGNKLENESLREQLVDKEDKVRRSKLLEVKLLEIEMEFGKKSSALSSKLRHKEEELRQKDVAHQEEKAALKEELNHKASEQGQRTAILEGMFAQKEKDLQSRVDSLEERVEELSSERDEYEAQVKDLTATNQQFKTHITLKDSDSNLLKEEIETARSSLLKSDDEMAALNEELLKEKKRADNSEAQLKKAETELNKERQTVLDIESKMLALKDNISQKMKSIESSFSEKENEHEKEKHSLQKELDFKTLKVEQLEKELSVSCGHVKDLEAECDSLRLETLVINDLMSEKNAFEKQIAEKHKEQEDLKKNFAQCKHEYEEKLKSAMEEKQSVESQGVEMKASVKSKESEIQILKEEMATKEKAFEDRLASVKTDHELSQQELQKEVASLSERVSTGAASKEEQQAALRQAQDKELSLQTQLEHSRLELINKLSELEDKNKENCELALELSQIKHNLKAAQSENSSLSAKSQALNSQVLDLTDQLERKTDEYTRRTEEWTSLREDYSELEKELEDTRENLNKVSQSRSEVAEKFETELQEKEQMLEDVSKDLEESRRNCEQLKMQLSEKEQLLSDASSVKEEMLLKHSDLAKALEEKSGQEVMVQEQMLKSESMLQESRQETESKAVEVAELQQNVRDRDLVIAQQHTDMADLAAQHEDSISQLGARIVHLEAEVEQKSNKEHCLEEEVLNHRNLCNQKEVEIERLNEEMVALREESKAMISSLETKAAKLEREVEVNANELRAREDEIQSEMEDKKQKVVDIELLQKQLEEKEFKLQQAMEDIKDSCSQVDSKQQEIESYKEELHKCLDDIENFKKDNAHKEQTLKEANQTYHNSLREQEELTVQLQERDLQCQQLESQVTSVEQRLVGAENRYRELESKCSSLQLQLEESFSTAEEAQQLLVQKEKVTEGLQGQLAVLEDQLVAERHQVTDKEDHCSRLEVELKAAQDQLDFLTAESTSLKSNLELKQKDSEERVSDIRMEVKELEKKYSEATMQVKSTEDRLRQSLEQCALLEDKFGTLEQSLQEKDTECSKLSSSVSDLTAINSDAQRQIESTDQTVATLQDKCKQSEDKLKELRDSLEEKNTQCQEMKEALSTMEDKYNVKRGQYNDLKHTLKEAYEASQAQEQNIDLLKTRLSSSEMELKERVKKVDELCAKISLIETALSEKEAVCADTQSHLESLQEENRHLQEQCEAIRSNCNTLETVHKQKNSDLEDAGEKVRKQESIIGATQLNLNRAEKNLEDLRSEHEKTVKTLEEYRTEIKNKQDMIHSLEDKVTKLENDLELLRVQQASVEEESGSKDLLCDELRSKLEVSQGDLHQQSEKAESLEKEIDILKEQLLHSESAFSAQNQDQFKLSEENQDLKEKLESTEKSLIEAVQEKCELESEIVALQSDLDEAAKEFEDIQNSFEESRSNIESRLKSLSSDKESLETECASLTNQNVEKDQHLQSLTGQLREKEMQLNNIQQKLADFEDQEKMSTDLSNELQILKEDKVSLQKEVLLQAERQKNIEASHRQDDEDKQSVVDGLLTEIAGLKEKVSDTESVYSEAHFENLSLLDELSHVKAERTVLENQVTELQRQLTVEKTALEEVESRLRSLCSDRDSGDEAISETDITLSLASSVGSSSAVTNSESVDANDNEITHRQYETKIQKLCDVIELNASELQAKKREVESLQAELQQVRLREGKLSKRTRELEVKEKELLEQLADIEQTVIIPLETETQELRDELSLVKEERDQAMSTVVQMVDEENVEAVQRSLRETEAQRDELLTQVDGLNQEIDNVESDRALLMQKVSELQGKEKEGAEKRRELEKEIHRLLSLERQASIVEESETQLMDKVLDLEERERGLLAELEELKVKKEEIEALTQKLEYLEQKNEVLQDAEGKYMDRIMELEENQQVLKDRLDAAPQQGSVTEANVEVSETIIPSQTLTLSQTPPPQVQSDRPTSEETAELLTQLETKDSTIRYLEEKVVLLQNSEAKLMESLLEANEGSENRQLQNGQTDPDLKAKLENLTEENEFLAQSVENFKQMYKEEKEKTNELHDRMMEDTTALQELQETQSELRATQQMVEEIQSEYEDQLSEKEAQLAKAQEEFNKKHSVIEELEQQIEDLKKNHEEQIQELTSAHSDSLSQNALKIKELSEALSNETENNQSKQKISELQEKIQFLQLQNSQMHSFSEVSDLQQKIHSLEQQNESMLSDISDREAKLSTLQAQRDELQQTVESHKAWEETLHAQEKLRVQELQGRVDALTQRREEQRAQHRQRELRLKEETDALRQKEAKLVNQVEDLQRQLRARLPSRQEENSLSQQSDSGLSADEALRPRSVSSSAAPPEAPPPREVTYRSKATLQLARPSSAPVNQVRRARIAHGATTPPPVAPPRAHRRGSRTRLPAVDSSSQDELNTSVDEFPKRPLRAARQAQSLDSLIAPDTAKPPQQSSEAGGSLERRNRLSESRLGARSPYQRSTSRAADSEDDLDESKELNLSFCSVLSTTSSIMLDKPEDVLQQKIRELEGLDKLNKAQMTEMERDREMLHEIARKDKAMIHDLNVKIRELQLTVRSLKEQVESLEASENSLFSKCDELEAQKTKLEDRVHELEIHERRLRELVRRLKLDEEHWLSKSGGMETAVAELSANEQQLKRVLQDVEMEKGGLAERAQYLEARVRELENVEATLLARVNTYEKNEVSLQNRLVQLENAEAAAHSKASELDVMNLDLSHRLQKAVEENAVLSQHITQLHGQVQELDRRLMSSQDSELAYKQHLESLQKNESSLQKKVREYELREIDSQARIRELEQTDEISKDKLAALQRSENKLKYRVQELEGLGAQIPGELTPGQRQAVPQRLEDCQKRVVVLQAQVENLQLQLRQTLNASHSQLASQDDENTVNLSREDFAHLQTRSAMLEETEAQMEQLEMLNDELNETILQLRQGKGASGHEVEIEVLKNRVASYKTFISKLKSSLPSGQATSLWESEPGSGPKGDNHPPAGPYLPGLASERVLQSVRGLPQGKAPPSQEEEDTSAHSGLTPPAHHPTQGGVQSPVGASTTEEEPLSSREEESHWRAIEARRPTAAVPGSRGGAPGSAGPAPTSHSHHDVEEVTVGLDLYSESDLSSYHRYTTQNDTDSSCGPVRPPRRGRQRAHGHPLDGSSSESEAREPPRQANTLRAGPPSGPSPAGLPPPPAANTETFDKDKSLPCEAPVASEPLVKLTKQAPLSRFARDDSFYLPSPAREDSMEEEEGGDEPPPLPTTRPPNMDSEGESTLQGSQGSLNDLRMRSPDDLHTRLQDGPPKGSQNDLGPIRKNSSDISSSGMSIRERIALIEKQLQSDASGGQDADDQMYFWKKQSTEALKQADTLGRENKYLSEEINRLEKELEEKRRYINLLELWLSSLEDLLKNKSKQTDREMVEQLQRELVSLRSDLAQCGYRPDQAVLDPAALKTELEHRDRDILTQRHELDVLTKELQRSREECRNVEDMRRTALDSLRHLEKEVVTLQDKGQQLETSQEELQLLKTQYDEMERFKNQAVGALQPLQNTVDRLTSKCQEKDAFLRRLAAELRRSSYHRPQSVLDDLTRLEQALALEAYQGNPDNQSKVDRIRDGIRSSSMDELDLPFSDTESVTSLPLGPSQKPRRPTTYVNNRPRSAETLRPSAPRRLSGPHAHPASQGRRGEGRGVGRGPFVAIADYDPSLFSQSGRPHLELGLRERDHVTVTGPMDPTGYYEAVVNGQSGLVPANYLQPVQLNGHPSQACLQDGAATDPHPAYRGTEASVRPAPPAYPDPPGHLHIREVLGEKSVLLAWSPPHTDPQGKNNGFKVLGYMVYLDNKEYEQVPSSASPEVVVEGLSPAHQHQMAVQCLCAGGFASPKAELVLQGMVTLASAPPPSSSGRGVKPDDLDTDLSSVLNSLQYKKGHKKTVMALYDYSPEEQSPHDYTALELPFGAGEVIQVYGEPRKDGFYHGEINGKRGLVPACFVEELSKMKKGIQKRKNSKE